MEVATLYVAGALVSALAGAAIWMGGGLAARQNGLCELLGASLSLSAALALFGLRGQVGEALSQGGGITLLVGSALAYRIAIDRLQERDAWQRLPFAASGIAVFAVWLAIIGDTPPAVRAVTAALAAAAALALPAWALFSGSEAWRGRSRYFAGSMFVLGALVALARAVSVAAGAAPTSIVADSPLNQALALAVVTLVTVVSLAFLVLLREREQARLAMLDGLTGLFNRRAFEVQAAAALALAKRRDLTCCAVIMEIDAFGRINDAHGSAGGDQVLRHCSDLLRQVLRREDVLGRYGGDEFAMLFFATPASGGQAVAQRIATALAAHPPRLHQLGVPVTASFGVAEWMHGSDLPLDELLLRGERACRAAKAGGGKSCVVDATAAGGPPA